MAIAVVATAFGGPEALQVVETSLAAPAEGQVLLEVRAAGTNPIDYKRYSGAYGTDGSQLPMRLGYEAAGVVVELGGGAEGPDGVVRVGQEVVAYPIDGAYASQVLVPASAVVHKPSNLSFEEASGLMLAGTTAVHALSATRVGAGSTVLVHGAAGGVGRMVVQLAHHAGAQVVGTASAGHHDDLRRLGAQPVSYGDGLVDRVRSLVPTGIDAAIDTVGTDEALDSSVELVSDRSRIATIAGFARGGALGVQVLGGGPGGDPGTEIRAAARLQLVQLAEEGALGVLVARTYPLSDAGAAHRELASGHTNGKIVLVP